MKRLIGFLSVATLASVLAAAQPSFRVTATVPFDFMVAGRSMTAGDYAIGTLSSVGSMIQVTSSNTSQLSLANISSTKPTERNGEALLIFNRYGDRYFLSRVVDGSRSTGFEFPTSTEEKELAKTASIDRFETVAVLARR